MLAPYLSGGMLWLWVACYLIGTASGMSALILWAHRQHHNQVRELIAAIKARGPVAIVHIGELHADGRWVPPPGEPLGDQGLPPVVRRIPDPQD